MLDYYTFMVTDKDKVINFIAIYILFIYIIFGRDQTHQSKKWRITTREFLSEQHQLKLILERNHQETVIHQEIISQRQFPLISHQDMKNTHQQHTLASKSVVNVKLPQNVSHTGDSEEKNERKIPEQNVTVNQTAQAKNTETISTN